MTTATTSVQGSGWGALGYEPLPGRLIIEQLYDHHGNVGLGSAPLLVFDAWEHAYYLQYKNVRPDYVSKLWDPRQLERRHGSVRRRSEGRFDDLMNDAHVAFATTADAAQRAAGVIAARHRGDFTGAETLLDGLNDQSRAAGSLFLADLALALFAQADGRDIADVASELSLHIAELSPTVGG